MRNTTNIYMHVAINLSRSGRFTKIVRWRVHGYILVSLLSLSLNCPRTYIGTEIEG